MKTKYKFIHFEKTGRSLNDKSTYGCVNNGSGGVLGIIQWYQVWKQYCFFPYLKVQPVFSMDCFEDIQNFVKQLK